jgi:TetR/AcrR family transcriptional regulator, cholesterol catabolism regulator
MLRSVDTGERNLKRNITTKAAPAPNAKSLRDELHDFKRNRVLDVASQLFYDLGYSKTSVDAIAAKLSVTKPFVYYHFDSKADILAGVCARTTAFVAELAEEAASGNGMARDRLLALVRDITLCVIEGRIYLAVYFRAEKHLPETARRELADFRRRFDQALRRLLQQGVESGEFRIAHITVAEQAITGMTTWLFNWYRPDRDLTADDIAGEMSRLALSMVEARPALKIDKKTPKRRP